jgi:hypothetical protein
VVILELIHALISGPHGTDAVIRIKPSRLACHLVNLNNAADRMVFVPATYPSNVCLINRRW